MQSIAEEERETLKKKIADLVTENNRLDKHIGAEACKLDAATALIHDQSKKIARLELEIERLNQENQKLKQGSESGK